LCCPPVATAKCESTGLKTATTTRQSEMFPKKQENLLLR
jgi:hypothetical protein